MQGYIERINSFLNGVVWGPVMLAVLLGIGLYFSVRTGFFQVRRFGYMLRHTVGGLFGGKNKSSKAGISPFQAVSTALAGTLGTGNIVGVSTAIISGGPGAIFWMWVSAVLGMMTKYAEVFLAIKFRRKNKRGEYVGGPMYYIEDGLKLKPLAVLFALFCICASFGIGNMTQSNSVSAALYESFNVSSAVTGVVLALFAAAVIIGGIKRIGKFAEKLVPLMSVIYILFALIVLVINHDKIIPAFRTIFDYAFNPASIAGGNAGYLVSVGIKYGVSRGVFSNEAGLGSAPIAHAAVETDSPVRQGLWGMFEVFFDTIICCTITALVIITSGDWNKGENGAALTLEAFSKSLGGISQYVISISMVFFAFCTILGWSYYGEKCVEYLFGKKQMVLIYRVIYIAFIVVGATQSLELIWSVADTLNGLMAIPNIAALILLSSVVIKETKKYIKKPLGSH